MIGSKKRARAASDIALPSPADVRELRERHQLTQVAAGALVHVTGDAWRKWEQGKRAMDRRSWELALYKLGELRPPKRSR